MPLPPGLRDRIEQIEPDCPRNLDPLRERLREAATWCASRVDLTQIRGCLRSPQARPRAFESSYFAGVRLAALWRWHGVQGVTPVDPRTGRLLVYFPDMELSDGAAEVESEGFFDLHNAPPWDTWVAFVRDRAPASEVFASYLLAWVPGPLIELAARGIAVNPEECILWLRDSPVALASLLADLDGPR